jgi:membrane protein DedA with SNARE-associated domain
MDGVHWIYALLVLVTVPPMVPNSAVLAGAGALAAAGGVSLTLLVVISLASAILGDLAVFGIGRASRGRVVGRLPRGGRWRMMLDRAADGIQRDGVPSVIAVRFVPTGRGVGGLAAGIVGYPLRSYVLGAAVAEVTSSRTPLDSAIWAGSSSRTGSLRCSSVLRCRCRSQGLP